MHGHVPPARRHPSARWGARGSDATTFRAAIVGGTGAYAGARGTLTLVSSEHGGSTDTLVLLP